MPFGSIRSSVTRTVSPLALAFRDVLPRVAALHAAPRRRHVADRQCAEQVRTLPIRPRRGLADVSTGFEVNFFIAARLRHDLPRPFENPGFLVFGVGARFSAAAAVLHEDPPSAAPSGRLDKIHAVNNLSNAVPAEIGIFRTMLSGE